MLKIYLNKKNVRVLAGALAGAAIMTTTGCNPSDTTMVETSISYEETPEANNNKEEVIIAHDIVTTSSSSDSLEVVESVDSDENTVSQSINLEDVKPAVIKLTAENVVAMSRRFADHINKTATLSHNNYKFAEIQPEDLYAVVYLANIDFISKEETARLIENGIISDNANENIVKSFYFYELYYDDTINKVVDGKSNLIDLTLILSDEHDISVAKLMNKIMVDSTKGDKEQIRKNYVDTVYYYANGDATLNSADYDYSKSIYETDRDRLTVGGSYVLGFAVGQVIENIAKAYGVNTPYLDNIMYDGRTDIANIVNVSILNGCSVENNNTFVK